MDEIDVIARIAKRAQPRQKEGTILSVHPTTVVVQPRGSTRTIVCAYNGDTSGLVGKRCVYLWVQPSKKYVVSSIFNAPATVDLTKAAGSSQRRDHLIHDNVGGEFISPTEKVTPVDDDLLLLEDSEDLFRKKRVRIADLSTGGGGFYQTVQDNGADQTQRGKLNFIGTTIADNPGNDSTDVTVTGGGGGGGTPPTLLLNYTEAATVFNNTVLAATTWTDVGVNHTFTITDAAALIDITAVMAMQVGGSGSAIDIGLRLVIDSAGTPIYHELGGGWAAASAWYEPAGGSIKVSGLSVGAHTVKLQVYATSAAHLFLDPSGLPDTEGMTLQVTQFSGGGSTSALASDKKSLTSGDVTVTSTSFADLDSSLDITLTTGARRCLVTWNLVVTSTGSQSQVDVEIDGARVGGSYGLLAASASGINANLSGTFLTDVLTAGSHTFKLMVRVDGATSTYRANTTDNPAIFSVEEQANTQGGGSGGFSPMLIYDYTLPSDGTFDTNTADDLGHTGISQLYTDLELRISGIGAAGVTGGVEVFFNGDTNTAHYDGGRSLVNGGSSGGDLNEIGFVGTSGVGSYGAIIADVPGYTLSATHRTLIARSAVDGGGTSPNFWQYACQYNQAGALTRFQAHCRSAGNFAAGSRLRIYGIP